MDIFYSPHFARSYKKLPESVKILAEKREKVFRKDWQDTTLDTHKLKGKLAGFWAFSIDKRHRILFEFVDKDIVYFHNVGDHDVYK